MNPGSAVPAWLQQILPQFFLDRPAFTEALYTALRSFFFSSIPIFTTLAGIAA